MSFELRARAALAALQVFGFNPGQKRGPDGRWIKMGGAGSAGGRPRSGRARSRRLRQAIARWTDPASAPNGPMRGEDLERLGEMFNFTDPQTGAQVRVRSGIANFDFEYQDGSKRLVHTNIDITDRDGKNIGSAARTVRVDPRTGELVVDHTQFNLNEGAQGTGLSSRWLRQAEQTYRDAGVSQIQLSTADVGGYAWAKAGFDFAGRNTMRQMADRFELRSTAPTSVYGDSEQAKQQMRELADRARSSNREDWPLPIEFAMIGWEPGATTWPGKDGMLGTSWRGVKRL